MNAARRYHEIALDCLNLAEVCRDRAAKDTMVRMAELWARLGDHAELLSARVETEHENRAA
jgi:hypothetical protein